MRSWREYRDEKFRRQRYRETAMSTITGGPRVEFLMTTGAPSREDVFELLRAVIDPELGSDIVTLGMVPDVVVSPTDSTGGVDVTVWVKLTIGGCPLRGQIKKDVESRVALH